MILLLHIMQVGTNDIPNFCYVTPPIRSWLQIKEMMRIDPSTYQEAFEEGKPLLSWGPYQGDNHVREHHRSESNETDRQK